MKKILITGGAGFVGRHFVEALLNEGHEIHAVDPIVPLTGALDPLEGWPLFEPRDFNNFHFDRQDCRDWFKSSQVDDFDYAYHLAAVVGGRAMIEHNPLAVADDLSIDAAYWQWAKACGPKKTVCFSSSAAYPIKFQREQGYRLLTEDMIQFDADVGMPDMSYGWAKLTCEYLAELAHERHGLRSIVYRPFSGYGEDQDLAYPFPSICRRVLANRGANALTVWGSGRQMRDFIHIDDCVRGVLHTVDSIDDGGALNLSTGVLTSFADFARLTAKVLGFEAEVVGLSSLPEGVFARGGDTTKQQRAGFRAEIPLERGIERALESFSLQMARAA